MNNLVTVLLAILVGVMGWKLALLIVQTVYQLR